MCVLKVTQLIRLCRCGPSVADPLQIPLNAPYYSAMQRLTADKIASATKNVPLSREIRIVPEVTAAEGFIVAGKILNEKSVYNTLENCQGRMVRLHPGDIVVGVLGHRNALQGYTGHVPASIRAGDVLNVLNLGGVIGLCSSVNPEVGRPFDFEVLGSVLVFPEFENRVGVPAHVRMNAAVADRPLEEMPNIPVVFISGTCMNAGKTLAASQAIRYLSSRGLRVAACKLTGVSLLRDTLAMTDYGARIARSFVDVGIVTTGPETAVPAAREIIASLSTTECDVIIAELGDGILGEYGVQAILANQSIMQRRCALVLCANDPPGAWAGVKILSEEYQLAVDLVSGPTTDNVVGTSFIERSIGVPAINARTNADAFGEFLLRRIKT